MNHKTVGVILSGAIATLAGCVADVALPPETELVAAELVTPTAIAVSGDGNILIVESGAGRIISIDAEGAVTTLVSGFAVGTFFPYDIGPLSLLVRADGTLIVGEGGGTVGNERVSLYDAMGVEIPDSVLTPPSGSDFHGLAIHPTTGELFVASAGSDRILRVTSVEGGTFAEPVAFIADTTAAPVGRRAPSGLAFESDGSLIASFADFAGGAIVRLNPAAPDAASVLTAELYTTTSIVTAIALRPSDGAIHFAEAAYSDNRLSRGRVARLNVADDGALAAESVLDNLVAPSSIAFAPDDTLYIAMLGDEPNLPVGIVTRIPVVAEEAAPTARRGR